MAFYRKIYRWKITVKNVCKFSILIMIIYIILSAYSTIVTDRGIYAMGIIHYLLQTLEQYPVKTSLLRQSVENIKMGLKPPADALNQNSFNYVLNCDDKCKPSDEGQPFLIFLVKSKTSHFDQRQAIRKTWGQEYLSSRHLVRTVFLLGLPTNEQMKLAREKQEKILEESNAYGDIVQQDFIDSYYNNTIKLMMGFYWVSEYCANTNFVIFCDDDMYIHPYNLLNLLLQPDIQSMQYLYMGYVPFLPRPVRDKDNKWFISKKKYPSVLYAPYATTGCMILNRNMIEDFTLGMSFTKLLPFDDIFFGIVAWKLGIIPTHNHNVYSYRVDFNDRYYQTLIATHGSFTGKDIENIWNQAKV